MAEPQIGAGAVVYERFTGGWLFQKSEIVEIDLFIVAFHGKSRFSGRDLLREGESDELSVHIGGFQLQEVISIEEDLDMLPFAVEERLHAGNGLPFGFVAEIMSEDEGGDRVGAAFFQFQKGDTAELYGKSLVRFFVRPGGVKVEGDPLLKSFRYGNGTGKRRGALQFKRLVAVGVPGGNEDIVGGGNGKLLRDFDAFGGGPVVQSVYLEGEFGSFAESGGAA